MDIVHDTYGQLGSWDDDVTASSSTPIQQQPGFTNVTSTSSNNIIMKNVLTELENKDGKINALEIKLDKLISTISTLVPVTNNP
jgi:hypothetical protein